MFHLHIANATINLPPGQSPELGELFAGTVLSTTDADPTASAASNVLTPPPYGERWLGQGGFYGGTWPAMSGLPARHLVFGERENEAIRYGGYGEDEPVAASRINGRTNTAALLASGIDHPAARWCVDYRADGHADFHLPSQADLFLASLCAAHRFKKAGYYLSSTQGSRSTAFVQDFEYGYSDWGDKGNEFRAVPVRWIHFTT